MIPFSFFEKYDLMNHADKIRSEIVKIKMTNKHYQDNVYAGTNSRKKVYARFGIIWEMLSNIIGKSGLNKGNRFFSENIKKKLFSIGYKCSYCGNEILSVDDCDIDHIIPFTQGGSTDIQNAQLLHRYCNQRKGNSLN